ncbi:MAG: hypothetical protein WBW38_14045 [Candidatus Sulfotelmatobacter sp.]
MSGPNQIIGGNFQDFEGNVLANGYLTMQLSHDAEESVGPGQVVAGFPRRVPLDANGNIAGTVLLWPNDQLNPANTYYIVNAYRHDGTLAWAAPQFQTVTTSPSPFNVGVWIPNNPPSGGAPVGSILLQHNGINNSSQAILDLESTDSSIIITDEGSGSINLQSGSGGGVLKKWPGQWSMWQATGMAGGTITTAEQGFNLETYNLSYLNGAQNICEYISFVPQNGGGNAGFDDVAQSLIPANLEDWFVKATLAPQLPVQNTILNGRYWIGMWDGGSALGGGESGLVTNSPVANLIAFRFASQTDTNIQAVCATPSGMTVVNTGVPPPAFMIATPYSTVPSYVIGNVVYSASGPYNYVCITPNQGGGGGTYFPGNNLRYWLIQDFPQTFEIVPTAGGTVITFYINGSLVATIGTNVPNPGVPMRTTLSMDNYSSVYGATSNAFLNLYYLYSLSTP